MDDPPNPVPKPMTDDYDIFQGDVMLYSHLMCQMSINVSVGTSGTQYEPPCPLSYHTSDPFIRVLENQLDEVERHERSRRQT
jgi:hypothetical protein